MRARTHPNTGWRNTSFRGYADYMQTEAFAEGLATLIHMSRQKRTAIMCAEAVPLALPPLAGGRCAQRARHPGGRDFIGEQLPHA